MEKLAKAHECGERGARLLATNPDNWCPVSIDESVGEYVYQPSRVLNSVADLTEEVRTGLASDRLNSPVFGARNAHAARPGQRHQTDVFTLNKPRPRPAMTK